MAVKNFIPELWATMVLSSLQTSSVAENFVNHNYEGIITGQGDTVNINILNDITVKDYKPDTDIVYDDVDTTLVKLALDQAKYCAISLDDVDKVQAAGELLDPATRNMAYNLNKSYDKYIFDTLIAGATAKSANMIGSESSPIDISDPNKAIDVFVDVLTKANQNNIPAQDRRVAVSPVVAGAIMKSDKRSITPKFAEFIDRGYVGNMYGAEVFQSNNLAKSTSGNELILVTTPEMTTVANQILQMEALRSEARFKDLVRALHVYGGKVVYDTGVVGAYLTTTTQAAG